MDILYAPFGFLLRTLYNFCDSYLLALVLFTIVFKLVLLPSSISQQKSSAKQTRLQTKVRRIRERYNGDKDAQRKISEETQQLYSREGSNPMGQGCLPLAIQMPIILGLYGVIYRPLSYALHLGADVIEKLTQAAQALLSEEATTRAARQIEIIAIENVDKLRDTVQGVSTEVFDRIAQFSAEDFTIFGVSLGEVPSMSAENKLILLIPLFSLLTSLASALITFIKQKQTNPEMANNPTMGCMTFGMPLFSLYITFQFPAGIGFYWIINNVFTIVQMLVLNKLYSPQKAIAKDMVEESVRRRSREANRKLIAAKNNNQGRDGQVES